MPGNDFTFESSNVHTKATEIEGLGEDIKTILENKLSNEMERLQSVWKSNAATAYKQQFEEYSAEFIKFYEDIQNMANAINASSTKFNTADEESNVAGA